MFFKSSDPHLDLSFSISLMMCRSWRLRNLSFTVYMMPWSIGWDLDIVFAGKNFNLTFENSRSGWKGALSIKSNTFHFCLFILTLNLDSQDSNNDLFIHAFLLWLYMTGSESVLILLKQCGCLALPITNGVIFSPVILEHSTFITFNFHYVLIDRSIK
jgi:hypothetical protein